MLTEFPGVAIKGSKGTRQEEDFCLENGQAMTNGVAKATSDHPALGLMNMFHKYSLKNVKIIVH